MIVIALAIAYPVLVFGLGAVGFTISALLTRSDSDEFGDFEEGGGLISALLVAIPVVVAVAHVVWARLAVDLLDDPQPRRVSGVTLVLVVAGVATFVVIGSGVGPVHLDGWGLLAATATVLTSSAALAAVWLTRTTGGSSGPP